ncbi:hypothetical protein IV417_02925 [Alphaproteobacteria bacterium KMM 3653]|uniref:Uncharacterized protein n=1 Tax=Harenicola maris TaxID=2841044 RepID=A0AAP2CKY1_9RHOB|nr:hypothetical protein [Harenicola maris]
MAYTVNTIAEGKEALEKAREFLAFVQPIDYQTSMGKVSIPVGTVDLRSEQVIIGAASPWVYYLHKNKLKAMGLQAFATNMAWDSLARDLYDRTKYIVPVATAMANFCIGLGTGLGGPIVTGLVVVTPLVIKFTIFYSENRAAVDAVAGHLNIALHALDWMRKHCPVNYRILMQLFAHAGWEAMTRIPDGITMEALASIAGGLIGGWTGAMDDGLFAMLKILASSLGMASVKFGTAGIIHNTKQGAEDIIRLYEMSGIIIGKSEARILAEELERPGARQQFTALFHALEAVAALGRELNETYEATKVPGDNAAGWW